MRLLALAAIIASPQIASADRGGLDSPRLEAGVGLGLATPLGALGGDVAWAPHPAVSIELGAGLGFSGLQFAGAVRGFYRLGFGAISAALGASHGDLNELTIESDADDFYYRGVTWVNAELALEIRLSDQSRLRLFGGWSQAATQRTCGADERKGDRLCTDTDPGGLPFVGLAYRRLIRRF